MATKKTKSSAKQLRATKKIEAKKPLSQPFPPSPCKKT